MKWALVLPIAIVAVDLILLQIAGVPDLSSRPTLLYLFIGLNAPVLFLRTLPVDELISSTGTLWGFVTWGLKVVAGAPVLWYFVGRYLDGDLRWPRGRFRSIAIGLFLLWTSGLMAFLGLTGIQYWNWTNVRSWPFDGMLSMVWSAVFFCAAWRQLLEWCRGSFLSGPRQK